MDLLIFVFGSGVTLIVGAALAIGIAANNRQLGAAEQRAKTQTAPLLRQTG